MHKILYVTNITAPYRIEFFNQLSQYCDLTVLYERKRSNNRAKEWNTTQNIAYRHFFLNGIKLGNENSFSLGIVKYIFGKYDSIIIGCFNSPVEMFAILLMKLFRIRYYINIDGELFVPKNFVKRKIRDFIIKGAYGYLCAGVESRKRLYEITESTNITVYKFSSLTKRTLEEAAQYIQPERNNNTVLVVGQYENYKGLDIAAQVAKKHPELLFKFVGVGKKKEAFVTYLKEIDVKNAEVISFIKEEELQKEYLTCGTLLLPSRQECWGLVINEGAAYGIPIISTWGSGAARDFLHGAYERFLANPDDVEDLNSKLSALFAMSAKELEIYSDYLKCKAREYYIEENVLMHKKTLMPETMRG